ILVAWGGKTIIVQSPPDARKRLELKHPALCNGAGFIPGGRLMTGCNDGLVRVWDLSGGTELQTIDLGMGKIFSFVVSPDHMTCAAAVHKNRRIVLLDVPD